MPPWLHSSRDTGAWLRLVAGALRLTGPLRGRETAGKSREDT